MALKLITAASTYPVTLAQAKVHCRVEADMTEDDALITALITTATEMAEQETGRSIASQTWELTLDAFPSAFELTKVPVQSITSVKYFDINGVQQTLDQSNYSLDSANDNGYAYIVPAYGTEWPDTRAQVNAVSVRYVAGYATTPEPIRSWILVAISTLYENRLSEDRYVVGKYSFVDRLLYRYKVIL